MKRTARRKKTTASLNGELGKTQKAKELNPNEMEQVSGGGELYIDVLGERMSRTEFDSMLIDLARTQGKQVALNFFERVTGQQTVFSEDHLHKIHAGKPDEDYVQRELDCYWAQRER